MKTKRIIKFNENIHYILCDFDQDGGISTPSSSADPHPLNHIYLISSPVQLGRWTGPLFPTKRGRNTTSRLRPKLRTGLSTAEDTRRITKREFGRPERDFSRIWPIGHSWVYTQRVWNVKFNNTRLKI